MTEQRQFIRFVQNFVSAVVDAPLREDARQRRATSKPRTAQDAPLRVVTN